VATPFPDAADHQPGRETDPQAAGDPAGTRAYGAVPLAQIWTAVLFSYLALGATLQELPRYVPQRFHAGGHGVGEAPQPLQRGTDVDPCVGLMLLAALPDRVALTTRHSLR
jgi:hypothetical protein